MQLKIQLINTHKTILNQIGIKQRCYSKKSQKDTWTIFLDFHIFFYFQESDNAIPFFYVSAFFYEFSNVF